MNTALQFLKTHYKKVLFVVLPVAAFVAGRYFVPVPERVVTQERIVERVVIKEVIKEVEKIVRVKDTTDKTKIHTETTKTTNPDGTVIEKTVTDTGVDKTEHEKEEKIVIKEVIKEVFKDRIVEKIVTVDNRRDWRAGVLVGISPNLLPAPSVNSILVGGEIDRRIVGPFSVGVWGMGSTTGQGMGGLSLKLDF